MIRQISFRLFWGGWLLASLFLVADLQAQTTRQKIKVSDMLNIRQVTQVALHPGGEMAVYVLNSIEPDKDKKEEYNYINRLALVSLNQPDNHRMLTGKEGASQPAWSPDGQQLAFVRAVEGKPQIFLLRLDGGEAIQLTQSKYGASNPVWHPTGNQLLFSAQVSLTELYADEQLNPGKKSPLFPLEKPGYENEAVFLPPGIQPDPDGDKAAVQAWLQNNVKDKKAKVIHHLNFQEESTTSGEIYFNHLFITSVTPGAKPKPVTTGFGRFGSGAFTPDGKQIILTGNLYTTQHPDRVQESSIFLVDTGSTQLKKWLGEPGWSYTGARISPTGKWVAFQKGQSGTVDIPELYLIPMNGNLQQATALPFDRNKGNVTWSEDEKNLFFTAQSNGGIPLYRLDISGKKITAFTSSDAGIGSFDLVKNRLVYAQTTVNSPFELMTSDGEGKNQRVISSLNSNWLANKEISRPEKRSFVNEEGMTVEYWIMKPAGFEAGKKYATILNIHGGPSAMWGPGENSMWHEFQYYCARGYVVVYANPRGSGGYGVDFLRANKNNWGAGPTRDVLTALEKAAGEGFIDTSRLAVTGGSYAGYLVAWIISHDQRFKAACSQRGVYELTTFMGEGNAWRLVPNYFGGYPFQPEVKKVLDRESPLHYVENIRTPYIIFHGENDLRTGVIQSEMIYRSLKILGRPVEYVRHPGATHEITRSGNNRQRMDQMLRTLEFFERYIRP